VRPHAIWCNNQAKLFGEIFRFAAEPASAMTAIDHE
jgi:hypothetical protein